MKKMMNNALVAMIMVLAMAMPAKADNRGHVVNSGRRDHVAVVDNHKKDAHFDKKNHKPGRIDKKHAYRPDMKTCSIRVGHRDNPRRIEAKALRVNGVKDAHWNARTREVIVSYDANRTSAHYIKRVIA